MLLRAGLLCRPGALNSGVDPQDILENRHAKLATHLESLGGGTFSFYGSWFRAFFVGWLPSEVRLRCRCVPRLPPVVTAWPLPSPPRLHHRTPSRLWIAT